jgi:tRNA G18 (ribose-2'-O)-methylase SpoU
VSTPVVVDDADDPRLSDYRYLRDVDLRRSTAADHGIVVVEGTNSVRRLLESALKVRSVLLADNRVALADEFGRGGWPVYVAPRPLLEGVTGFNIHRGVLAAADRPSPRQPDDVVAGARRVLVIEAVTDSENLGSLFRNAAAFAVDAVVLDPTCGDPLARRPVRVSVGHSMLVPFARASSWPDDLRRLRAAGIEVIALTPDADAAPLASLEPPRRPTAVLVGGEGPGLTQVALAQSDRHVRVPMASGVDSLNVATAAAIAFWHLWPQPPGRD